MSVLRVDNFGPSAGGTTYSARGISKAWVNFDGTGTIAARDSENVSSLTDDGAGQYFVNFTNNFSAADYCGVIAAQQTNCDIRGVPAPTASSFGLNTRNNNYAVTDSEIVNVAFHGDLA